MSIGFFLELNDIFSQEKVPPASKTFWEHGAGEHLMVPGNMIK